MTAEATPTIRDPLERRGDWVWTLTLAGVWFWAFRSMSLWWQYSPAYEYAFVVPWIALFLAWQRVRRNPGCIESPPAKASGFASAMLIAFIWVAFLFGELLRQIDPMWRPANWVLAFAASGLTGAWAFRRGGLRLVRELAFPVFFTWTALPWPGFLDDPLTMKLRALVTVLTVQALHAVGIGAVQDVNVIQLANGPVGVEDACSGIVSFHSSLMAALFFGEFFALGWLRRVLLVAGGCALAVAGNLARTFALCWLVNRDGLSAVAAFHDRLGFYAAIAIFLGVAALAWGFSRLGQGTPATLAPPEIGWRLLAGGRMRTRSAVVAFAAFAAVPALGFAWFALRPSGGVQIQEAPLWAARPQSLPESWRFQPIEMLDSQKATLGFTLGQAFAVQHPGGGIVQVYHLFWGAERSGLPYAHTPDICMSYIGWTQPGPARDVALRLGDTDYPARGFRFERQGQEITALHTFWRGGEPGLTGNALLDNRRLARLPLLWSGPRLFGMEELLVFVTAAGDDEARIRLAGEVLSQILTRTSASEPVATASQ